MNKYKFLLRSALNFYNEFELDTGLAESGANKLDKFFARGRFLECPGKIGRGSNGMLFLHPPHLHAQMLGFNNNCNAKWF